MLHRGAYYATSPSYPLEEWFATTYAEGIVPNASRFDLVEGFNPSFVSYSYKSGTDTYTANPDFTEHADGARLRAICENLSIDPEAVYLHWDEPTTVTIWPATPVSYPAGARVEVYQTSEQSAGIRNAHDTHSSVAASNHSSRK